MERIIIDTDPGVDDALAITLAIYSRLTIAGITTVYGNSHIKNSVRNALTILQLLEKSIPVYRGAYKPLYGQGKRARSHGDNGLGGFTLKKLTKTEEKKSALEFLANQLQITEKKSVSVASIGPLTNLALLQLVRPDLCRRLKRVVIVGGVFFEKGNVTSHAEFNVYNDPLALDTVLNIECEKILIPINICRKIIFTKDDFIRIKNKKLRSAFKKISRIYIKYYTSVSRFGTFTGGVMYDVLAIAYLLDRSIFKVKKTTVEVAICSQKRGKTTLSKSKPNNCSVVTDVNAKKIKGLFLNTINSYRQLS